MPVSKERRFKLRVHIGPDQAVGLNVSNMGRKVPQEVRAGTPAPPAGPSFVLQSKSVITEIARRNHFAGKSASMPMILAVLSETIFLMSLSE